PEPRADRCPIGVQLVAPRREERVVDTVRRVEAPRPVGPVVKDVLTSAAADHEIAVEPGDEPAIDRLFDSCSPPRSRRRERGVSAHQYGRTRPPTRRNGLPIAERGPAVHDERVEMARLDNPADLRGVASPEPIHGWRACDVREKAASVSVEPREVQIKTPTKPAT